MNNFTFKKILMGTVLLSFSLAFPSCGMEKSDDTQATATVASPSTSNIAKDALDVESTIKEIEDRAKYYSAQDSKINLHNIMDTIHSFDAPAVKVIYSYLISTFFSDGSDWKTGLSVLGNPHIMRAQENKFKLDLFSRIRALVLVKEQDSDQNTLEELEKFIPNLANLKKLAQKNKVTDSKILKEMKDIKGFSFGTFHFENLVKQITSSHSEITLELIKEKLLDHMDKYLNSLIRTFLVAKSAGKELEFFQEAFGTGCNALRYGYLQRWTLKHILQIEPEDEFLRIAKEKVQTDSVTKFNHLQLNARMILLMRSRCIQLDFPVEKFANESEATLQDMAKYIYSCLNRFEKSAIKNSQSQKPQTYVFNILNTFLEDFREPEFIPKLLNKDGD